LLYPYVAFSLIVWSIQHRKQQL